MNNNYLITQRYNLDFTGTNPDNYIDSEVHEYNPLQTNRVALRAGSFYHGTTTIYLNNRLLTWNVDYFPELYDQKVSELANKEASRLIRLKENLGGGELKISYQTPGSHGTYIDTIKDLIETIQKGNGNITWSSIRNKPEYYPPAMHTHSAYELYGYDALVYGTYAIATAIKDCYIQTLNKINVYHRDLMTDIEALKNSTELTNNEVKNSIININNKINDINNLYNDFVNTKNKFISIDNFNKTIRAINNRLDNEIIPVLDQTLKYFFQLGTSNLNNIKGINRGMYSQSNPNVRGKDFNYPIDDARGTLFVFDDANGNINNGGSCRQVFYCYNSHSTFHRFYNADTDTWSEWIPLGGNPDDAYVQYIYPNGTAAQPFNITASNEIVIRDDYQGKAVIYVPEVKYLCRDNVRRWVSLSSELSNDVSSGINIGRSADGWIAVKAGSTNIISANINVTKLPNVFIPNEDIVSAPFRIAVYRQSFIIGGSGSGGGISAPELQAIYDAIDNVRNQVNDLKNYIDTKVNGLLSRVINLENNYVPWSAVYYQHTNEYGVDKFAWKIPVYDGGAQLLIRQALIFGIAGDKKRGIYLRDDMTLYANTQFIAADFRIESDKRLKSELTEIDVDKLLNIDVYQYKHKDGFYSYGVMAQDVEKVFPYAVSTYDGYKTVNYNALSAITIGLLKKYINKDNRAIGEIIEVLSGSKISNDYVELNGRPLPICDYPELVAHLNKSEKTKRFIKDGSIYLPKYENDLNFIKYIKVR